ncbi:MAG: uroporphyrinogen decarboxylase family protein [Promethearchaeota archaeon]
MQNQKSNFLKTLSKESTTKIPLYCTGYPEEKFIHNYIKSYNLDPNKKKFILNDRNYYIIEKMGFDAISLWDFRKGKGGYILNNQRRVDGWGRIYKGDWYMWDGVFKDFNIVQNWSHLNLPSKNNVKLLKNFLNNVNYGLEYVISLPGLFEKTWQSMGLLYFAKCLRRNINLVNIIIKFFSDYLKALIEVLQNTGATIFLIADDYGYKNRTIISNSVWKKLFFREYKEIINYIHNRKQKVIIHSDGYIPNMIDIFIDLGFDGIQSLEPNAGVDIFSLFKKFQNQICFIGNIDISFLSFGTPLQIKDYVIKLIKKARKYNCYLIVSPAQQINSTCVPENINAMIETTINI